MHRDVVLFSVRPVFVRRILDGTKTVELRRVRPQIEAGHELLIYSSSPTMALLAHAVVDRIETSTFTSLWTSVKDNAGVTWEEYNDYFSGAEQAVAIWLREIVELEQPITLSELRKRWPWFRPPQSYCFLRARVEHSGRRVTELAPRV